MHQNTVIDRTSVVMIRKNTLHDKPFEEIVRACRCNLDATAGKSIWLKIKDFLPTITVTSVHRGSILFEFGQQFRLMCGPFSHRTEMCRILSLTPKALTAKNEKIETE
jgi:hypothetical protein